MPEPQETHLISSQDLEGGHDLIRCIRVSRLSGHEVDEGLERHYPQAVGVYDAHDAGKLCLSLEETQRTHTCHPNGLMGHLRGTSSPK